MRLLQTIRDALHSWRHRRDGTRSKKAVRVALEPLDHRRLLTVNFTGNAILDIPDNIGPGFAIVRDDERVPIRDPQLNQLIRVSGFDIDAIRMFYDVDIDTLSVAIEQPLNEKTDPQFPVIAGDADNNLNGGTVDPLVRLVQPLFMDFANLGGSETMGIFFDLNNDGQPDVVAGVPNTPGAGKFFVVSEAVEIPDTSGAPAFGTPLPRHTGYAYLRDTEPTGGAFEFQITNFSELYQTKTGQPLRPDTVMGVGGFGGSNDDFIDEEFVAAQPVNFGVAPPPPEPPVDCPPLSPPILVNPHGFEGKHKHKKHKQDEFWSKTGNRQIDTAHPTLVRVSLLGTSGFDVTRIDTSTVRLGGAAPVASFTRNINRDDFLDITYVFRGDQIDLTPGFTFARLTGEYVAPTGQRVGIDTGTIVFNRDASFWSAHDQAAQARRQSIRGDFPSWVVTRLERKAAESGVDLALYQLGQESARPWSAVGRPMVSLPTGGSVIAARHAGHTVRVAPQAVLPNAPGPRFRPQRGGFAAVGQSSQAIEQTVAPSAPMVEVPSFTHSHPVSRMEQGGYLDDLATSLAM